MSKNKVLIGIQARTTSTRLPNKILEYIGHKRVIDHVIERCKNSSNYMNVNLKRLNVEAEVAVLAPYNDPIIRYVKGRVPIVEGPEDDVLTRYALAVQKYSPDYLVRITSDCPLIEPWVISKMVSITLRAGYHYANNVEADMRSHPDGWDCEVIHKDLFAWANRTASDPLDREHVTTIIRRESPEWASLGLLSSKLDLSSLKLSIDTPEDLDRVKDYYNSAANKLALGCAKYGKDKVHIV